MREFIGILIFIFILPAGCSTLQLPAPAPLPHVSRDFETPAFWIKHLSDPQSVILTSDQISEMNRRAINGQTALVDLLTANHSRERSYVAALMEQSKKQFKSGIYYDQANRPISSAMIDKLFASMAVDAIPERIEPAFSLITRSTDLRELPTEEVFTLKPNDIAFDSIQYARIECGTPAVILHGSANREWYLVQTSFAVGWVRALDLAVGTKESIRSFLKATSLVVTGEHADVFLDRECTKFSMSLPMGARLPEMTSDLVESHRVLIPVRDESGCLKLVSGYVRKTDRVHSGYLPYTMENLVNQAFKLRGEPYGWGGLFGGRDCSRFIHDVFRSFSFNMPVNSFRQSNLIMEHRIDLAEKTPEEKIAILKQYEGKPVLLYLKGHIMLYLGMIDGRPYAIHSTWAYRERHFFRVRIRSVGGVVVSDLSLGEAGASGSLLERVRAIAPMY